MTKKWQRSAHAAPTGRSQVARGAQRRRPKWMAGVTSAACAGMLLAACGSGGSATANTASSGTSTTAAPATTAPITVGFPVTLTGGAAAPGADEKAGWELGLKGNTTIDGHKIETIYEDAHTSPTVALSKTKQLLQQTKVKIYVYPILGSEQLAVRGLVQAAGIPAMVNVLSFAATLASPNTVYDSGTVGSAMIGLAKYAYAKGYRHVTTIGMDYSFGWGALGFFDKEFKTLGGTIQTQIWNPIYTQDFDPFIAQVPSTTQAVVSLEAGANGPTFTKAYNSLGLAGKIPLIGQAVMTDFLTGETRTAVTGVVTAQHYADGIQTKTNQDFVTAFHKATGRYPSYEADGGYVGAKLLVAALKKTKGTVKNTKAFMNAILQTSITAPRGPVTFKATSAKSYTTVITAVENQYVSKVETVSGVLMNVPIKTYKNAPAWIGFSSQTEWFTLSSKLAKGRP